MCVKNSVGMNGKRGVNCSQICSLLFLFLLGGVAGNMIMMQTTVMLGVETSKANPDASAHDKAIETYELSMWIEFKAVLVAMFASILFGYIYELFSKKCVLITCFVGLCIGMSLPFIEKFSENDDVIVWSRIIVCVLVQAII